jgi:predicted TIM-barrel fold metal-dependent hydrolase
LACPITPTSAAGTSWNSGSTGSAGSVRNWERHEQRFRDPAGRGDRWLVGDRTCNRPEVRRAFAPLERGAEARDHFRALRAIPSVVGVRRLTQDERPGFAVADRFLEGVATLADFELTFDVCARSSQLDEVIELVRRTPGVQFVLDHVGKPRIGADPSRWRLQIAELAARHNIVCKLSGLMTEIVSGPTGVEAVQPFLAHAVAEFGPDRCLFGSDWPVMTKATTYSEWLDLVTSLVSREDERRAVLAGTAERVYNLPSATGES